MSFERAMRNIAIVMPIALLLWIVAGQPIVDEARRLPLWWWIAAAASLVGLHLSLTRWRP